jgi:hypothetical protein
MTEPVPFNETEGMAALGICERQKLEAMHEPAAQGPLPTQVARVPCGCPEVTCVQVPRDVAMSHALHRSMHAVLQQTPSTQTSDAHSDDCVHADPLLLGAGGVSMAASRASASTGALSTAVSCASTGALSTIASLIFSAAASPWVRKQSLSGSRQTNPRGQYLPSSQASVPFWMVGE